MQCGVTGRDLSIASIPTEVLLRFIVDLPIDVDAVTMPGLECEVMQGDVVDAGIPSDNTKVIMMQFQPAADFVRSSCGIGMKS